MLLAALVALSASCPARPVVGSVVGDPKNLYSSHGVLSVDLRYRTSVDAQGQTHYCYVAPDGSEAPTLRVKQGDTLILRLKNEEPAGPSSHAGQHEHGASHGCTTAAMSATATNLHFHGMSVPPVCHQDDVLNTLIEPIRNRRKQYEARPDDVLDALRLGTKRANEIAEATLALAKKAMKQDYFPRKLSIE